ncbi:hypothetical protein L1987_66120 [Smallanthus sonchifolius]|uniref:Uncharacterized protein n=1 Tax=Smallanthus sonchifolius TaxID=185202 RepID=A0ACB9BWL0_9ASTR|nr:hypothetical protein L1987_66120 [Smallanthus sonchifolius]
MARVIAYQKLATLLVLLNFTILTSSRPLSVLKTVSCPDANNGFLDRFSLGSIKDGPSPGIGHGFDDLGGIKFGVEHVYQPGEIKDGPSHGVGHELITSIQTLGGIKDGPSPGIGHKIIN